MLNELSGHDITSHWPGGIHTAITCGSKFIPILHLILQDEFVPEMADPSRIESSKHMHRADAFFEKHKAVPKARFGEFAWNNQGHVNENCSLLPQEQEKSNIN